MLSNSYETEQKKEQDISKESIPEFSFTNFFDLDPNSFEILNPYNLNDALKTIENMTEEKYSKNYLDDYSKKDFEFKEYEEDINFSIDNISFLTSTIEEEDSNLSGLINIDGTNYEFISLVNFVKNNYIFRKENKNQILINSTSDNYKINDNTNNEIEEVYDTGINFKLINKDEGKKEIIIKCSVNPEILEKNIFENLITKSPFPKAKQVYERILKYRKQVEQYKKQYNGLFIYELDIKIPVNSINKVLYNNKGLYLLDLQHPPNFRTNFLIDPANINDYNNNKNNNYFDLNLNKINNYNYYENIIFPFRNFKDEISNLKYRHFYILIEKKEIDINNKRKNYFNNGINDTNEEFMRIISSLFKTYSNEIDISKLIFQEEIYYKEEFEFKNSKDYIKPNYELSNYFKYESNKELKKIFQNLNFIQKDNADRNKEKEDLDENIISPIEKVPNDENLIKLYYQILALISEGILSYYNAIEFVENLLFNKTKNYHEKIFNKCKKEDYPILLNLSLEKLLDKYQNSLEERSLSKFEADLNFTFKSIYHQFLTKNIKDIINPTKNSFLIPVQRCTITPTFILFAPYALAQGNRILRDFLSTPVLAMLCSYKMEDFKEGRWNNQILIEYIKYIMAIGFPLGEKIYKFFNFSQSQFRNKACWLLTEPDKILRKTGNYSKIKNVAKFGARVSQNLTTTIKTIKIPSKNIIKINDITKESSKEIYDQENKLKKKNKKD